MTAPYHGQLGVARKEAVEEIYKIEIWRLGASGSGVAVVTLMPPLEETALP